MAKVAIFVVTYNRLEILSQTIESYKRFTTDYEVVIVNNGTDNPKCVALLEELSKEHKIFTGPRIFTMEALTENINNAVKDYYNNHSTPYFAVSDCDCCFDIAKPNTLDVFIELAEKLNCGVGPHYVVDDIPVSNALRNRTIKMESRILYRRRMRHLKDDILYSDDQIDTTFCLFKRRQDFPRLQMPTIRVLTPYAARHLDWYIDCFNLTEGNLIYMNKDSSVGSTGGHFIKRIVEELSRSKENAFNFLLNEHNRDKAAIPGYPTDHSNNMFFLSWMYQFGHGCQIDIEKAKEFVINASPNSTAQYNSHDVFKMIFDNDFSCLR